MLSVVNSKRKMGLYVSIVAFSVIGYLFVACADLDRSNPLDPKNPGSKNPKIVLVEAFVSQGTDQPYNDYALQALDKLVRTFKSNLIVLEYHVQAVQGNDSLANDSNLNRYKKYVNLSSERASPHVFFSGNLANIQGASTTELAYRRYEDALTAALNGPAHFTIEATAELSATNLTVKTTVARLGSYDAENVTLYLAIIQDLGKDCQHRVVREFLPIETFGAIEAGEIKSANQHFQLTPELAASEFKIIVFAQDAETNSVFHAVWVER